MKLADRRFVIYRDPRDPSQDKPGMDEYPWYVTEMTFNDDRDNYGRMESHEAAISLVEWMIADPHEMCLHKQMRGRGECSWEDA